VISKAGIITNQLVVRECAKQIKKENADYV